MPLKNNNNFRYHHHLNNFNSSYNNTTNCMEDTGGYYDLPPPTSPLTSSSSSYRHNNNNKRPTNINSNKSNKLLLNDDHQSNIAIITSANNSNNRCQPHLQSSPSANFLSSSSAASVVDNSCVDKLSSLPASYMEVVSNVPMTTMRNIDLLTRTPWIDAETALLQIEKGKALGNKSALWLRALLQSRFFELGRFIQKNAGKVLFVGLLVLVTFCVGLKSATIENDVEKLWVEEGGRLEKEMQYIRNTVGEGFGSTNQIVIQTPRASTGSVLHPNSLLLHLEAMRTAIHATVDMFDVTWKLKDICYSPSSPGFDTHYIDSLLDRIFPCAIITPLDCFWEGAKLLGPEFPVPIPILQTSVQWTDLNPEMLVESLLTTIKANTDDHHSSSVSSNSQNGGAGGGDNGESSVSSSTNKKHRPTSFGPLETIRKFMKRAGITTAYQYKPCLDPTDPNCPSTAPNHRFGNAPDIGAELTGGCYGFATKFMHWPEDLIVGGVGKNKTGHIVRAKALQSIVQLMGEQEMFDFYQHDYKVHNLDWSVDKAKAVLEAWQRKFSMELQRFMEHTDFIGSKHHEIHLFTSTSLMDIMRNFSDVNFIRLGIGYLLMLLYAGYSLSRWNCCTTTNDKIERSQSFLGMMGVVIIGLSATAGLGICALLGLPFNASTTQIIPFLALGLGVDNMFLLAHTYSSDYIVFNVPFQTRTAECLKQTGASILLSSFGNVVAFTAAAIIPIPALRCFALQAAILIAIISLSVIILFPALASIDLRFRNSYIASSNGPLVSGGASSSSSSPSTFVNLFFYVCCCGGPRFSRLSPVSSNGSHHQSTSLSSRHQAKSSSSSQISSHQLSSSSSSNTTNLCSSQYKQPYNYYYLNSVRGGGGGGNVDQNVNLDSARLSPSSTTTANNNLICRCAGNEMAKIVDAKLKTFDIENSNDEMFMKLVQRKCCKCGGDLRTQCDGQDEGGINGEFKEEGPNGIVNCSVINQQPSLSTNVGDFNGAIHEFEPEIVGVVPKPKFVCSISYFVTNHYIPLLQRKPIKALVLVSFIGILFVSCMGVAKVNDGLDLTDIVPRNTIEHRFLDFQRKYFSFFHMFAVTKGNFDYPNNQKLLHEYHQSFTRVGAIIKNDDGGLPEFWLSMFRDWLLELQDAFDRDWESGCITRENWFANASDDGVLAYKLLVQTGRVDNPVDKSLVLTARLVDEQGIVNPKAFYNYLSAWVSNDALTYSAAQASFRPEPRHWVHVPQDVELKIPKSQPLVFTQLPFYLNNIRTTAEITNTIEEIRAICRRFEDRSLPNFPTGIPFTYWEQYVRLRFYLLSALIVVLAAVFLSICIFLLNPWTAIIIVFVLIVIVVEVFGFMGWIGVKLSAIPAVILIVSIGIGVDVLTHITISFLTSIGDRNKRMAMALEHMFTPVMHGIVSTLFGICMLAFSEFDFIIRYFFYVLFAVVLIGTFNALIFLPVLLSILGPSPEIVPLEYQDRISTPSPPASPMMSSSLNHGYDNDGGGGGSSLESSSSGSGRKKSRSGQHGSMFNRYRSRHRVPSRVQSEISLSTISEEPNSYQSSAVNTPTPPASSGMNHGSSPICSGTPVIGSQPHEILVQPEFVVETTITNNNPIGPGCYNTTNQSTTNFNMPRTTSVTPTSENGTLSSETDSPSPTSLDRDSPSGRSESVASGASSTGLRSGSRCGSAASFTTTTTTSTTTPTSTQQPSNQDNQSQPQQFQQQSTTVTTKVMATAKLTVVPQLAANGTLTSPMMPFPVVGNVGPYYPGTIMMTQHPGHQYSHPPPHHHHQHHHTPEPCRNCQQPPEYSQPPPPQTTVPSSSSNACYRSGAWNHGLIGPNSLGRTNNNSNNNNNQHSHNNKHSSNDWRYQ